MKVTVLALLFLNFIEAWAIEEFQRTLSEYSDSLSTSNDYFNDITSLNDDFENIISFLFNLDNNAISSNNQDNIASLIFDYLTPQGPGVSSKCAEDGAYYLDALNISDPLAHISEGFWYLKMFDASAKLPPPGMLQGNFHYPGSFSSCLEVDAGRFKGQHCLMTINSIGNSGKVPEGRNVRELIQIENNEIMRKLKNAQEMPLEMVWGILGSGFIKIGHCVPDSCSEEDVTVGFTNFLAGLDHHTLHVNLTDSFKGDVLNCHTMDETVEWEAGDFAMLVIVLIFGLLIVIGTFIDLSVSLLHTEVFSERLIQIFQGFSLYHNTIKLFNTDTTGSDTLACINGIRFLSISWVFLGHTYFAFEGKLFINNLFSMLDPGSSTNSVAFMAIKNGAFSVDSFFFIGAVLSSYLTLKQLDKANGASVKCGIMFYVHRYLRISGLYAMVIGLHATFIKFLATGPQSQFMAIEEYCQVGWWTNLLYINVWFDGKMEGSCVGVSWYLSNEMWMFIFSPLIIYPLWKWEKIGIASAVLCVVGFTAGLIANAIVDDVSFNLMMPIGKDQGDDFYFMPWYRAQPYIMGLIFGYILFKLRNKPLGISKITSLWIWAFAGLLGALCVYGPYDTGMFSQVNDGKETSKAVIISYVGLSKLGWSLALGWVILACVKGHGGPINSILSWGLFTPLGRMSYCIYLIHMTVIDYVVSLHSYTITFTQTLAIYYIIAILMVSTGVAYALVMVFEAPFMHMEKLLYAALGIGNMPVIRRNKK